MKSYAKVLKCVLSMTLALMMLLNTLVFAADATSGLDADLYWTEDFEGGQWSDVESADSGAIFSITDFESGSETIRYLKVANSGGLAFSYELKLISDEIGELANVIEVYCKSDITANAVIADMTKIGTLAEVINGEAVSSGNIMPEGDSADNAYTMETVVAFAFKMDASASSDYMNKTTGEFSFQLDVTSFDAADKFEVKFENTDSYLYRVGNANTVKLGSLFKAIDGADIGNVSVTIEKIDEATDVSGTYTANETDWTQGEIKFSGTGSVMVTIDDDKYANSVSLCLEVVAATNVTTYSELGNKNSVFLNDITMTSGGSKAFSNVKLYGNGFTFDVSDGAYAGSGTVAGNYLVSLSSSTLDNMKLIGAVYTTYGGTTASDYNRALVLVTGTSTIANCYISNCAAPVRVNSGDVEIINTTLKGGNYANLDIRNGNIVLDNVTTINQVNGNDLGANGEISVGLGVVVFHEQVLSTSTIEVRNGITQYNNLSKTEATTYITDDMASNLVTVMYSTACADLQYTDADGEIWVNAGILSMSETFGDANVSDVAGYTEASPTMVGVTGYVHTQIPTESSVTANVPEYVSAGQYAIAPTYSFEYPSASGKKNYIAKTDGSNKFCYYSNGAVSVSFDQGDSVSFDTSILTVTKSGQTLDYTVTLDGVDCTGQTVTFDSTGNHTLTYTYTDDNNYTIDANGNIATYSKTYTKNIYLSAVSVAPDAKNASFNFVSIDAATKEVTIGNDTYVMPDVSATSDTIGSTTVSGNTIYMPIIECAASNGKTSQTSGTTWYMLFPVFKNVIEITDYADAGLGDAVTYGASTTTLPAGLAANSPGSTFQYASASAAPDTPSVYSNVLYYTSPAMEGVSRNAMNVIAKYIYKDNAGKTYYYYVRYDTPKITNTSCLTGDTNITLADGSTKRIDEITYDDELLVWNFFDGKYDTASSAIIFNHGAADNTVIKLKFEDGTEVKVVNIHQFFDIEESSFVNVTPDTVASLVGRTFAKADGTDVKAVKLVDYEISNENIEAYGIISAGNYNIIAEGMLTTDFEIQDTGLFNYFEVGEDMTFANVEEDVEKYGLYTYEDFEGYLTPELFDAFNVKYMKVAVGKGQYTYEGILGLIEKWLVNESDAVPMAVEVTETEMSEEIVAPQVMAVETNEQPGVVLMALPTNAAAAQTLTITASGNTVTAANYSVTVSGEGVTATESGYVIDAYNADVVLTAGGTASTGYAKITVDGAVYYTNQIVKEESFTLTLKNAKGKEFAVESFWGNSADAGIVQDTLIESGKVIEYTYTVAIEATNATETESGYAITDDEATFTLTANGSATSGYVKISVNGDDYYTTAIAKGETFTFTVKNANGNTAAIEAFYGEPTAENLLANGSSIGYVAEITVTNAILGEDGKYAVNADEATITVAASGTSEGYAKFTIGEDVYYTEQIASGESFTLTLKNAKGKEFTAETIWSKSSTDGIAQDTLIAGGMVIEYTFDVEITASGVEESELGYLCLTNEANFVFTANGTVTMGYVTITVDGDIYYTESIAPGEVYNVSVKNAMGKAVSIAAYYGEPEGEIAEEYIVATDGIIDCGVFEVKSINGTTVTLSNTTKYESDGCDIYVAVYDSTGRMTGIRAERNVTVGGKTEHTFDSELSIPEGGSAKVFIWNANTMIPIF